jgi:tetratricopeptide (TPR) repeat protein
VWITDFGLAQFPSDSRLTLTGDLVGTLRYMSPEQAKGGNATLDHRTDIYSLGATLYELLTLEPALLGHNREELLRQAAASEYLPPRRVNRAVPAEFETIVLKAMANEPGDRYQTAHALADDLRRWLVGTPILARRPSWGRQLAWWGKRHRLLVATASVLIVAVLAFAVFDVWRGRQRIALLEQGVSEDIQSAESLQREGHWAEALQALERSEGRLSQGGPARLRDRVGDLRREIALVRALEACRLELLSMASGDPDFASTDQSYFEAFRDHGLEAALTDVERAASLIRESAIRIQIVAGLDDWANVKDHLRPGAGNTLRAVASRADEDAWRDRLRRQTVRHDLNALRELATDNEAITQPPANLVSLGYALFDAGDREVAEKLIRQAQRRHPADLWLNFQLGNLLASRTSIEGRKEAVGFLRVALAARPNCSTIYNDLGAALRDPPTLVESEEALRRAVELAPSNFKALGNLGNNLASQGRLTQAAELVQRALKLNPDYVIGYSNFAFILMAQGKPAEAEAASRHAIALRPDYMMGHYNLGGALATQGKLSEAAAAVREAIRLKPANAEAHRSLGAILLAQRQPSEAVESCRRALALKPDYAEAFSTLGSALHAQKKLPEAVEALRRAVTLRPDYPEAHNDLGDVLNDQGNFAEAAVAFRRAAELKPKYALALANLGTALSALGKPAEAAETFQKVVEIDPSDCPSWSNLGIALATQNKLPEAEAAFRRAIELKPDAAEPHYNLGNALASQGKQTEAIEAFRRAVDLRPDYARAHCNLGSIFNQQDKLVESAAAFRRAIAADPNLAEAHCNLGHVLHRQGKFRESLDALRRGHELGSRDAHWRRPSAQWVARMERLVQLDDRLTEVMKEEGKPVDAAERLALAEFALITKRLPAIAFRLYREALAEHEPTAGNLPPGARYNAACAAALVACNPDADVLDAKERARLRTRALRWLRAELAEIKQQLEKMPVKGSPELRKQLVHWLRDDDLAGVRKPEALNGMPAPERQEWQSFWSDVEALRKRTEHTE